MMRKDVLFVFGTIGAIWVVVAVLIMRDLALPGLAAIYVAVGSFRLARSGDRMPQTVNLMWAAAVVLWIAVMLPFTDFGLAVVVGAIWGSLMFGLWSGPSLMILRLIDGERRALRASR